MRWSNTPPHPRHTAIIQPRKRLGRNKLSAVSNHKMLSNHPQKANSRADIKQNANKNITMESREASKISFRDF
jgi:hypothetical protein